ncbi:hypothetical protein W02_03200 [Nitrospira sp. KM1]|uniref:DUF2779 domain-containing protein n=1 Tax=Nitrospira sp. KM1 TaxID=1936990 RepID=UPI0013A72A1D|nr:DUF2779 domain-containing protein [Nitrospira sp. KM1]BCA53180.1 hypothetical protein W02_03200 [Nitrospira sp. KM1]
MTESIEGPGTSPSPEPRLSKSKYLSGLQCHKRLYLEVHHPQYASPHDISTQAMLDMGTEIGELARRCFPGGILVKAGFRQREEALAETAALIQNPSVPTIFEGAFEYGGVLVRVDILQRISSGGPFTPPTWRVIEVKSSTKVKETHLNDLAIQNYVVAQTGISLAAGCLMHIDTRYRFEGGDVDISRLFTIVDVTEALAGRLDGISEHLRTMKAMLRERREPEINPGHHCQSPYECPFWDYCTKDKSPRWIYNLPGSRQTVTRLAEQGVVLIDDIPTMAPLSPSQRRVKDNVEYISPGLEAALRSIRHPVHHVDFETVMLAVPRYPSTKPYQSIPVQWSNHIVSESGETMHHEYLHAESTEPRERWAEALIESLGSEGSVCVYSAYEEAMLRQLGEAFPRFRSAINSIIRRLWDLHPVIRDHYYHPGFAGSYSIKSVLPAVVPSLGYDDLEIREGGQAACEYYRMVFVETDWVERLRIREALLQYCARDTFAMVELRRALLEKARQVSEM